MSTDKKRVQFRAPNRLIDRADALAAVLGEDRTDMLVIHTESNHLIMSSGFLPRLKSWASALKITVNAAASRDRYTIRR